MIDHATVQRIKEAANIVEVVSPYVHLTRRGANYMGLCPFHNEKTPSFSVSPQRNICYCFSCHKGGSPVNFIMEKEGVSYYDALRHLARQYGIKIEERELTEEERNAATEREGLLIAAKRAMEIMENDLLNTEDGRDIGLTYLYGRGVTEEAIRKFHLGYALDKGGYLTRKMLNEGFDLETLRKLGVTGISRTGNQYDKYRGRVIFPIMNPSGKVVGFGGRDISGSSPAKYINSPDSPLYHKNLELYGIYQAKAEIVRQQRCYLVEGYLDVISMWQSGVQNVVASSGTALTDGQIAMIHRFTDKITVLYDGDSAGIHAALRGIDMLLAHKMKVSALLLPDGHDPDSFAKSMSPEEFRDYINTHQTDIIRFKTNTLLKGMGDSPLEKAKVVRDVARSIACIPDEVEKSLYVSECSRLINVEEAIIARAVAEAHVEVLRELNNSRKNNFEPANYSPTSSTPVPPLSVNQAPTSDNDSSQSAIESKDGADKRPDGVTDSPGQAKDSIAKTLEARQSKTASPLLPLEQNLIRFLIRFGYLPVNVDSIAPLEDVDAPEAEVLYTVADYVFDELNSHSLQFETPVYKRIFDLLYSHLDEYVDKLDQKKANIEHEISALRKSRLREIAERVSTIADIERAERKLEEELSGLSDSKIAAFARNYPGDLLASHEDAEIRNVTNELINDRYVLSTLFTKNDADEDKNLAFKIQRAIYEWQNEKLSLELKNLLAELQNDSGEDLDKTRDLQIRIATLMQERSELARNCGERIVSSR